MSQINFLEELEDSVLTEATKFTSKEMALVARHSKDIFVGIEYEFHPSLDGERREPREDRINDIIQNLRDSDFEWDYRQNTLIESNRDEYDRWYDCLQKVTEFNESEAPRLLQIFEKNNEQLLGLREEEARDLLEGLEFLKDGVDEYNYITATRNYYSETLFYNIRSNHPEYAKKLLIEKDSSDEVIFDTFRDLLGTVVHTLSDNVARVSAGEEVYISPRTNAKLYDLNQAINKLKIELIEDLDIEEFLLNDYESDDLVEEIEDHLRSIAEDQYDDYYDDDGDVDAETVFDHMDEIGFDTSELTIWHQEHDGMVEFITKPLPLLEALKYMEKMHEYIDEHGYTSESSGQHVNISHRRMLTTGRNGVNPLKLAVLMDIDFMQNIKTDSSKTNQRWGLLYKYPARRYVKRLFDQIEIVPAVKEYTLNGFAGLEKELLRQLRMGGKYQGINFDHLSVSGSTLNRLEMRFFGGKDYQKRTKEMAYDINFAAYALLAAYDPKFLEKDYKKSLVRILDRIIQERTPDLGGFSTLAQLSRAIASNDEATVALIEKRLSKQK